MARNAVGLAVVAEAGIIPIAGVMAGRTLPAEVVGRFVVVMAGFAIGQPVMAETGIAPTAGAVAGRTLPAEVI